MEMEMFIDACAGDAPKIGADIETVGIHDDFQSFHQSRNRSKNLSMFFFGEGAQIRRVPVRDDQQVTAIVRIEVHHNKTSLAAKHDKVLFVGMFVRRIAKQASVGPLFNRIRKSCDVLRTPWRKESFHRILSMGA
jgi:hypothetical protein